MIANVLQARLGGLLKHHLSKRINVCLKIQNFISEASENYCVLQCTLSVAVDARIACPAFSVGMIESGRLLLPAVSSLQKRT